MNKIAQNIAEMIEADILARDDCASFWRAITPGGRMMIMGDWADQILALLESAKSEEIENLKKCGTCGEPLGRDCPRCKANWES